MCFSRRLSTLVTLSSFSSVKQWSHCFNQLLSFLFVSLSFYLSVSSSFHWVFQAYFIRCFKFISSWHKVFQAHQTFQVYFFLSNVIEANSLLIHVYYIVELVSFMSLKQTHYRFMSFKQTYYRVMSSINEINCCLLIHICNACTCRTYFIYVYCIW